MSDKYVEYLLDGKPLVPGELLFCMDDGKVEIVYACSQEDDKGREDLGFNATNFKSGVWKSGAWNQELYPLSQFALQGHYKRLADLTVEDVETSWGKYDD